MKVKAFAKQINRGAMLFFVTLSAWADEVKIPKAEEVGMSNSGNLINDIVQYIVLGATILFGFIGMRVVYAMIDGGLSVMNDAKYGKDDISNAIKPIALGVGLLLVIVVLGWFVLNMFTDFV